MGVIEDIVDNVNDMDLDALDFLYTPRWNDEGETIVSEEHVSIEDDGCIAEQGEEDSIVGMTVSVDDSLTEMAVSGETTSVRCLDSLICNSNMEQYIISGECAGNVYGDTEHYLEEQCRGYNLVPENPDLAAHIARQVKELEEAVERTLPSNNAIICCTRDLYATHEDCCRETGFRTPESDGNALIHCDIHNVSCETEILSENLVYDDADSDGDESVAGLELENYHNAVYESDSDVFMSDQEDPEWIEESLPQSEVHLTNSSGVQRPAK